MASCVGESCVVLSISESMTEALSKRVEGCRFCMVESLRGGLAIRGSRGKVPSSVAWESTWGTVFPLDGLVCSFLAFFFLGDPLFFRCFAAKKERME
jgi:hypothetical protein